jgi:hypothetical protein
MADNIYIPFLQWQASDSTFDWLTSDIQMVLVNESGTIPQYTPAPLTDTFLSDIPAGARLATVSLTGKTRTVVGNDVILDAADYTFPSVSGLAGQNVDSIILFVNTTIPTTSRLIMRYSSPSFTGLPYTVVGSSFGVVWPPAGILKLRQG